MKRRVRCYREKFLEGLDLPLYTGQDAKILLSFQTPYQQIQVVRFPNGKKGLMLNGEVQYIEGETSEMYHRHHWEMLRHCPENAKRVAIIGGGDGILAGEILRKFPNVVIDLYELDPCMVYVYSKYETEVNHNALNSPRVRIIIGDAFKNIRKVKNGTYSAIFVDLPDAVYDNRDKTLYTPKNFKLLADKLKLGGCMSAYTGGIHPDYFAAEILPSCMALIAKRVAYGFLGAYGVVVWSRKIHPKCEEK